ncbi:hypothetical protein NKI54_30400 [Mesorhizobium sp. M0663]|uniref:hypothetical protein n=1 Tax=Mesorhizobium sp. M0663 TaxID=2956981 RepID=UPI003334B680
MAHTILAFLLASGQPRHWDAAFAERSASAMDHQCAQIATFADTEQAGSPSAGSLFRHQAAN